MSVIGRIFLTIGLLNFIILFSYQAFAKDIQIISVKKKLQMSEAEPVYRDFYINAGTADGFKKDTVFEIHRREAVIDQYKKKKDGTISIPVGKLRVIYSKENYSVAREYKVYTADDGPALNYDNFMIGDVVDVTSASVAKGPLKPASKPKPAVSAAIAAPAEEQVRKPSQAVLEPQPDVEVTISR